jgi:hypothetical protein
MLVRQTADLETNVVSVERLKEYSEVETEVRPFKQRVERMFIHKMIIELLYVCHCTFTQMAQILILFKKNFSYSHRHREFKFKNVTIP